METGKPAYFPVTVEDDRFVLLQATCAMPLLFPIYDYQGIRCLDGGVSDGIPWKRALAQGCDRVVVVLTRERSYRRKPEKTLPAIRRVYKKYPAFVETMSRHHEDYDRDREELFQAEREGKVLIFAPDSTQASPGGAGQGKDPRPVAAGAGPRPGQDGRGARLSAGMTASGPAGTSAGGPLYFRENTI